MARLCYCSEVLPKKSGAIRAHWDNKNEDEAAEIDFWNRLHMSGFECWLQPGEKRDYMIHCLEGDAPTEIFAGLRQLIREDHPVALKLQRYYRDVLGVDYAEAGAAPQVERVLDLEITDAPCVAKRGFVYPLLPAKVEEHRRFSSESNGSKRVRHEASLSAWGVRRLTKWIQKRGEEHLLVMYVEYDRAPAISSVERLRVNHSSAEWLEIADTLSDHTGLTHDQLSPDVEWLTA